MDYLKILTKDYKDLEEVPGSFRSWFLEKDGGGVGLTQQGEILLSQVKRADALAETNGDLAEQNASLREQALKVEGSSGSGGSQEVPQKPQIQPQPETSAPSSALSESDVMKMIEDKLRNQEAQFKEKEAELRKQIEDKASEMDDLVFRQAITSAAEKVGLHSDMASEFLPAVLKQSGWALQDREGQKVPTLLDPNNIPVFKGEKPISLEEWLSNREENGVHSGFYKPSVGTGSTNTGPSHSLSSNPKHKGDFLNDEARLEYIQSNKDGYWALPPAPIEGVN